jgi:enamidase
MRTGGNVNGVMGHHAGQAGRRLRNRGAVDRRHGALSQRHEHLPADASLKDGDDARKQVAYWADMGATSFKGVHADHPRPAGRGHREAHKRGLKVTAHLCSVTYAEAAALGIDNLEHGFAASTDFVADKKPDVCPGQGAGSRPSRSSILRHPHFRHS